MRGHITLAAYLHLLLGGLTLLGGIILFLIFGGFAGAVSAQGGADAGTVATIFHALGVVSLLVIGMFSLPNLLLGIGLLRLAPWARVLGIVVSILGLLHPAIGIGTLISAYSLWVFFQPETIALFHNKQTYTY